MSLDVPNLDTLRWADLVEEAQALIPRRAPRWTDHNAHDPGITFIELFAWLVEMQLYQLNRVGDRHREVFGRLAGVIRRERTPARVDVLVKGDLTAPVSFSAGTQLAPSEADRLVFETTTAVTLSRSRLLKVFVDDGAESIDQTVANEKAGVVFLAFGERAAVGSHFRLGFDRFYPDTESTLRLTVNVFTDDLGGTCGPVAPIPAEGGPTPPQPVELAWEYPGPGSSWLPLTVVSDETYGLARDGAITVTVPDDAMPAQQHVWIRCRVVRGAYDIEPRLRQISVNGLPCVQIETVTNQRLGAGNGRPDQSFVLPKKPILVRATEPAVDIEVGGVMWKLVQSFDAAGPGSTEFVFDAGSRTVTFGNGLNGRIPRPDEDVWARRYRTCEGRAGNVARDLAWQFVTQVIPNVTLTNTEPGSGGTDEESLHDLELRGRALLNRPYRAVTLLDIERLALGTPHAFVARACAIPDCPTPDRITVVAVPKVRPGRTQPPGQPSGAFLGSVNAHLQQRRLLGDNLRVVGPIYVTVRASARLRLAKGAGSAAVIERARLALDRFLAGTDLDDVSADTAGRGQSQSPCPTLWPFGRAVFPSEVYAVLDAVPGIDAVIGLVLTAHRDGTPIVPDSSGAIPVPRIGLVIAGAHDLTVEQNAGRTR